MRFRWLSVALPAVLAGAVAGSSADARTAADVLLSQGKQVVVSSIEDDTLSGPAAVDGSTATRWASAEGVDPQWIRVDLGQPATVRRVKLTWEAAYAKAYRIEISDDGSTFRAVKDVADGNGGTDDLTGLQAHGRYLRLVGTKRGTSYGYSLWELQVYGTTDSTGDTQPPSTPTGLTATDITATTAALTWTASTDNVSVSGYDVLRSDTVVAFPAIGAVLAVDRAGKGIRTAPRDALISLSTWRLAVLDLTTRRVSHPPESRNLDDQPVWQNDTTLLYPLRNSAGTTDIWSVGLTTPPTLLIQHATSPSFG